MTHGKVEIRLTWHREALGLDTRQRSLVCPSLTPTLGCVVCKWPSRRAGNIRVDPGPQHVDQVVGVLVCEQVLPVADKESFECRVTSFFEQLGAVVRLGETCGETMSSSRIGGVTRRTLGGVDGSKCSLPCLRLVVGCVLPTEELGVELEGENQRAEEGDVVMSSASRLLSVQCTLLEFPGDETWTHVRAAPQKGMIRSTISGYETAHW